MWITARKGGNMGKEIHTKYALLDMRPTQARYPVAPATLPNFHNLTPTSQAPATLSPSPAPSTGLIEITFTSNPPNALVTMYGQPVGRTPFTNTKLAPGTYDATFAASGYANLVQQVTVAPGYPAMVTATLKTSGN
jgi:hypothetical protein